VQEFLKDADREYFLTLMLSTKNNITGVNVASVGTLNSSLVHPREVFKAAILANAAAVVLVHNHPSGEATASSEDLEITRRLDEAGKILGIEVLDHVIVGDGCWVSLKEKGII
jgi:DNA repair protein RadC